MVKRNIDWIDWLKALCMFFVYWDHVGIFGTNKDLISWIYGPFFFNFFFFVSGYLIFRKQFSEEEINLSFSQYRRRIVQVGGAIPNIAFKIAIPSILFSMLLFVPRCIARRESLDIIYFLETTVLRGTYWFTCSLFVAEFVLYLLLQTRQKQILFYVFICSLFALLGNYLIDSHSEIYGDEYLPWFYKSGLIASLFLTFGGLFYVFEDKFECYVNFVKNKYSVLFLVLLLYLVADVLIVKVLKVHCPASCLTGVSLLGIVKSLMAILSMIYLCKILKNYKFVKFISRNTICSYFLSAIVPFVACKVSSMMLPNGFVAYVLTVVISFLVSCSLVYVLKKYLPFLFDVRLILRK